MLRTALKRFENEAEGIQGKRTKSPLRWWSFFNRTNRVIDCLVDASADCSIFDIQSPCLRRSIERKKEDSSIIASVTMPAASFFFRSGPEVRARARACVSFVYSRTSEIEKLSEKLSRPGTNGEFFGTHDSGRPLVGEGGIRGGVLSLTACCEINEPCTEQNEAKWRCRQDCGKKFGKKVCPPPPAAVELCA